MIVIGADTHKHSHTVGAVDAVTASVLADRTVKAKRRSFEDLLVWARGLDGERVWAIEDCRHVSGRWSASCCAAASGSCASRRS